MPSFKYTFDARIIVTATGPNYQPMGEQEVEEWLRRHLADISPGGGMSSSAGDSHVYRVIVNSLRQGKKPTTDGAESDIRRLSQE